MTADDAPSEAAAPPESPDPLWDDWETPPRVPAVPELHVDGFDGPLDLLLDLAERERIDLSRLSIGALIEQFVAALTRCERHVPIERRADWLVLATRLLVIRSRLLLARDGAAEEAAEQEAAAEVQRLRDLQFVRAAAAWLDARTQLGRDVFGRPARGPPPRVASYMRLMEACLAVLEQRECGAASSQPGDDVYSPVVQTIFRDPAAIRRIRAALSDAEAPIPLVQLVPRLAEATPNRERVAKSAVASTFVASLELARAAELVFGEGDRLETITCSAGPSLSR